MRAPQISNRGTPTPVKTKLTEMAAKWRGISKNWANVAPICSAAYQDCAAELEAALADQWQPIESHAESNPSHQKWAYHYCAVSQPRNMVGTRYIDGVATRNSPIITFDDYMELKSTIVSKLEDPPKPEEIAITSITLLENKPSQQPQPRQSHEY